MSEKSIREVISFFIESAQSRQDYLNKLRSIDSTLTTIFDNDYLNSLEACNEFILKEFVGTYIYEEIMWFLYERPHEEGGDKIIDNENNKTYIITDVNSFLDYLDEFWNLIGDKNEPR